MESNRWLVVAFLAGGLLMGAAAYSVGLSQGAAHMAVSAAASADTGDTAATVAAFWGWNHGHWHLGFPFGPILAIFFWVWLIRAFAWGFRGPWGWRRRWRHYDYYDDPRSFDDWHRRAHERMEKKS